MKLKVFSVDDIRKLGPCYDPVTGMDDDGNVIHPGGFVPENWTGTALDVLKLNACPAEDRLWLVLRDQWIDDRTLRLFAVWCARRALQSVDNPDPRSITACDVAEQFAHGAATAQELAAACDAARNAAWDSTWAAADAAARTAVKAAWFAARSAAEAAVEAAAWTVRVVAWNTARPAPWTAGWTGARAARAAAREEQLKRLIEMLEAED